MTTPCLLHCPICQKKYDWRRGYGREITCCTRECYEEANWRRTLSILGKPYVWHVSNTLNAIVQEILEHLPGQFEETEIHSENGEIILTNNPFRYAIGLTDTTLTITQTIGHYLPKNKTSYDLADPKTNAEDIAKMIQNALETDPNRHIPEALAAFQKKLNKQ